MQEGKKILIINGSTFLGTSLVKQLLIDNPKNEIFIIDKEIYSKSIKEFLDIKNVKVIDYELFFSNHLGKEKFNIIIYNAIYQEEKPSEILESLNRYKQMINTEISHENQLLLLIPLNNALHTGNGINFTSSIKSLTEEYIARGTNAKILNIGEAYGPNMDLESKTPLSNLIKESIQKNQIEISDEEVFGYYIYIDDAINGIKKAIDTKITGTFTLADPFDVSISSIALRISELLNKKLINNIKDIRADHLKNLPYILPDWKPEVNLETGLEKTFEWLKDNNILKNSNSIGLHSISNTSNEKKPIRNYSPKISVFRDIGENTYNKSTIIPNLEMPKRNLRSIEDIRKIAEEAEPVASVQNKKKYIEGLSNKLYSLKNSEIKQVGFPKKLKIILILLFLLIYLFVLIPFIGIAYYSNNISNQLSNFDISEAQSLYNNTNVLTSEYRSVHWIFSLFGQSNKYNEVFNNSLDENSFALSQLEYKNFLQPLSEFKNDFAEQNISLNKDISDIANNNSYANTLNDLKIAESEVTSKKLEDMLSNEEQVITTANIQNQLILNIFKGNQSYIISLATSNNSFSSNNITKNYVVSFNNGLYQGLTQLPNPKSFNEKDFSEFSLYMESSYSKSVNGVILIDQSEINNLKNFIANFDNSNELNSIMLFITSDRSYSYLSTLKNGITSGDIQIFINNSLIGKDDIIKSLQ